MFDRPTRALWGIGAKTARKLAELGLHTVRELAAADPAVVAARLGPSTGPWLVQLALGNGRRTVIGTPWVPRSHSRETTFQQNLTDWTDVRRELAVLAGRLHQDVLADGRPVGRVAVKVRFAPFFTSTRSATLKTPDRAMRQPWKPRRWRCSSASITTGRSGCSGSAPSSPATATSGDRDSGESGRNHGSRHHQPPQRDESEHDDAGAQRDRGQPTTVVGADEPADQRPGRNETCCGPIDPVRRRR